MQNEVLRLETTKVSIIAVAPHYIIGIVTTRLFILH